MGPTYVTGKARESGPFDSYSKRKKSASGWEFSLQCAISTLVETLKNL